MSSFLGVPILSGGGIVAGAFYLTDKEDAAEFSGADQKLFGLVLAAESGAALISQDAEQAAAQLKLVRDLAREAIEELRSVIVHLRPAALESQGLAADGHR